MSSSDSSSCKSSGRYLLFRQFSSRDQTKQVIQGRQGCTGQQQLLSGKLQKPSVPVKQGRTHGAHRQFVKQSMGMGLVELK